MKFYNSGTLRLIEGVITKKKWLENKGRSKKYHNFFNIEFKKKVKLFERMEEYLLHL